MHVSSRPVDVVEPAMLIRIPKLYHPGMSDVALYEATRAAWRVGPRRDRVQLALAVFGGYVIEVYEVDRWQPAGTDLYRVRPLDPGWEGRWEFVGQLAGEPIRGRYLGGSVSHHFSQGNQNPIRYLNC